MFSPRKKYREQTLLLETNLSAVPLYLRDNALHSGVKRHAHNGCLPDPDTYVCSPDQLTGALPFPQTKAAPSF